MARLYMWSSNSVILIVIALCGGVLISGCTSTGQGKIKQMGRVTPQNEEFALAAARNALRALTEAGVPEAAVISTEVIGIRVPEHGGGGRPVYYEVWVRVAECPTRVYFKAQAAGTIYEMNDKADCVAKAEATDAPAS
jgi:hypothetical protein